MKLNERFLLICLLFLTAGYQLAIVFIVIGIALSFFEGIVIGFLKKEKETYQHYKTKGYYTKLMVAKNADDPSEEMMIYKSNEDDTVWVRPKWAFEQRLLPAGASIEVARFRKVSD